MEWRETAATGAIGLKVMPIFPVSVQSADFPVIPKEVLLKIPDTQRGMRQTYPRSDWEFERGYYSTKENGWEEAIDDRERRLYETLFDAESVATQRAVKIIELAQEKRIADMVFNTSNFTANAITHEWDDATNAAPIDDVNTGINSIRAASGMLPNTLIISFSTFQDLKNCDQVVDRLKYTFPAIQINSMTSRQLATVFNLEQVLVGGAVYDSADKGQDASITDLWSQEYAMLTRVASGPDITEPCIGRTFFWTAEGGGEEPVVESYREENRRGDVVRVRHDSDERLIKSINDSGTAVSNISAAVSYLFSNVYTSA
jgi:hypothetical protein